MPHSLPCCWSRSRRHLWINTLIVIIASKLASQLFNHYRPRAGLWVKYKPTNFIINVTYSYTYQYFLYRTTVKESLQFKRVTTLRYLVNVSIETLITFHKVPVAAHSAAKLFLQYFIFAKCVTEKYSVMLWQKFCALLLTPQCKSTQRNEFNVQLE